MAIQRRSEWPAMSVAGYRRLLSVICGSFVLLLVLAAGSAHALDPGVKCESGQLKTAGKYAYCRYKVESKAVKKGETPVYSDCDEKYAAKFPTYEEKAGPGVCSSEGDTDEVALRITLHELGVAQILAGGVSARCGDGVAEENEACDGADLRGATCETIQRTLTYGVLGCTAGCGYDTSDCAPGRFEDFGETVLDHDTCLTWEKKTSANVGDTYTWTAVPGQITPDGTAFTVFLPGLNSQALGGYTDWDMPTFAELVTILDASCNQGAPCTTWDNVYTGLYGQTASGVYWSADTKPTAQGSAYYANFATGVTGFSSKGNAFAVRAVHRGVCP